MFWQATDEEVAEVLHHVDVEAAMIKASPSRPRRYRAPLMYPEEPIKYIIQFEEDCGVGVVTTGNVPADLVALFFWGESTKCTSQVRLDGSGMVSDVVECPGSASPVTVELHTTAGWGSLRSFNTTFKATCKIDVQPVNVKQFL